MDFKSLFFLFLSFSFLVACNKPDPNPELKDPIYADLNAQAEEAKKAIEAEEKVLADHEANLKAVEPQTGQIKYAQKRVYDSKNKLDKLKQEHQWLELRVKERLRETRKSYRKAFKAGQPWPDPAEYEQFQAQNKLRKAPREWSANRRIEEVLGPKGKESKKEEKKEGGEGGGGH